MRQLSDPAEQRDNFVRRVIHHFQIRPGQLDRQQRFPIDALVLLEEGHAGGEAGPAFLLRK